MKNLSFWRQTVAIGLAVLFGLTGLTGCSDNNYAVAPAASTTVTGTVAGGAALVGAAVTATGANGATTLAYANIDIKSCAGVAIQ